MKIRSRAIGKVLPLIAVWCVFLSGCNDIASTGVNKDDGNRNWGSNSTGVNITRDDAIRIAIDFVKFDTDIRMTDVLVTEKETSWIVSFIVKPSFQNRMGGGAWVEVDKISGEVVRFYFNK